MKCCRSKSPTTLSSPPLHLPWSPALCVPWTPWCPWSSQDTLSGTSVSPKSSNEALAARLILTGLILYVPLEEVTACLKISYCAAEIFLLSPSASSSSEKALLESTFHAALKLSGDSSRAVDSTEEDLEHGERDLESPDSLWFLARLTGVLGGLTGVLACLSASLAHLTKELMELWGIWRNLSDGLLSGDPFGVTDLLFVESCPVACNDDLIAGLMELSGTLGRSKRHWSNVVECWSPSCWKRLVHPLAWLPDYPALPIRGLPLLEEVLDHPNRLCHQNVIVSYEMIPPSRHLLGCHWLYHQLWSVRPLWQGRHLWPSRPLLPSRPLWLVRRLWLSRSLWPGHCLWPSCHLWSGRCLWPGRCALPGRHSWPSLRWLQGPHLPSRPLPGPGLLGPIQHESAGPARQPPWWYASQGPWTSLEIAGHPVWQQTSHPSYRNSRRLSR